MKLVNRNILKSFIIFITWSLILFSANHTMAGWHNPIGEPVTFEEAEVWFALYTAPPPNYISLPSYDNEIKETARALNYDPELIYNFVHNNIEYTPYYGLKKGAALTLLDGSGNDFDQAELMVSLLRESETMTGETYSPKFVHGKMQMHGASLANWLGMRTSDLYTVGDILDYAGIPNELVDIFGARHVGRVWVKATIDGVEHSFDPAYKEYDYTESVYKSYNPFTDQTQTVMGYTQADLLTSAGGTDTGDYVQNINEAAIIERLNSYASSLITDIRTNNPNAELDEIIGGKKIVASKININPNTPNNLSFPVTMETIWNNIPVNRSTILSISHSSIDCSFKLADIAGRSLTLTYENETPYLKIDGTVIQSGTIPLPANEKNPLTLAVDHPYASGIGSWGDATNLSYASTNGIYAIVYNFANFSNKRLQWRQKLLDTYRAQGMPEDSERVRGESLNVMGLSYFHQNNKVEKLLSNISETINISHHNIGIVKQEDGYVIDVGLSNTAHVDLFNNDTPKHIDFQTSSFIGSAFEHGVLEQLMGKENPAISTTKALQLANAASQRIYFLDNQNFEIQKSNLTGYDNQLAEFASITQNQGFIVAPEMEVNLMGWSGIGYIAEDYYFGGSSLGMIIARNTALNGGAVTNQADIDSGTVSQNLKERLQNTSTPETADRQPTISTPKVADPVDMASGAFVVDKVDLQVGGQAPMGLSFSRHYNSDEHRYNRGLGYGWRHNLDIYITKSSNSGPFLGERKPVDASTFITALYVIKDVMGEPQSAKNWLVASLVANWAVDKILDNSVTVHTGNKAIEYIMLPNGTYSAPPGVTTLLDDTPNQIEFPGDTFHLNERFGTSYRFNSDHRVRQLLDIHGNVLNFDYTPNYWIVTDAVNRSFQLIFSAGKLTNVIDLTGGRSIQFIHNAQGDLERFIDPENKPWQYGYNDHRMNSITNPESIVTAVNYYDTRGKVKEQTVPRKNPDDGSIYNATYKFYFTGSRNVEEDPLLHQSVHYFDKKGRNVGFENALGNKIVRAYNVHNNITEETDPRGNTTYFEYYGHNALKSVTTPNQKTTNYYYDSFFRLESIEDPLEHTTEYHYYSNHKLEWVKTFPSAGQEIINSFTYYPNGLPLTSTDGEGTVTTKFHDISSYWSLDKVQVGSNAPVDYTYNDIGLMTDLTNQNGGNTHFEYDNRGLAQSKTDNSDEISLYTYYPDGMLWTETDRNGEVKTYTYTPSNKIDTITYSQTGMAQLEFGYNAHNQRISMSDGIGTTSYTYDAAGRIDSATDPHMFTMGYGYDEAGNIESITYPGEKSVFYLYDELNRLEYVDNWLNQRAEYVYDDAGRLSSVTNFNGTATLYEYDNANLLTDIHTTNGTGWISSYSVLTIDGNGRPRQIQSAGPLLPNPDFFASVTGPLGADATTYLYTQPKANRMTSVIEMDGSRTDLYYDDEGQLVDKGDECYNFDAEHRLLGTCNGTLSYDYDGVGNRLEARRNGQTRRYIYDILGNLVAEADENNVILAYYIYGAGLLAMVDGSNVYSYHYDRNGNTLAMTDGTKNVVNRYAYTPYGLTANQEESIPQPFKYVGQHGVFAESDGKYYMRARFYDSQLRRFISEDPIGFDGGDVNLYRYVQNDPVNFIDPDGLMAQKLVKLTKTLYGKVMKPAAGKDARVKIYDKQGNYKGVKIFEDGRIVPSNAKLPQNAIDIAKSLLGGGVVFLGNLLDPFDAEAFGNGELPAHLKNPQNSCGN